MATDLRSHWQSYLRRDIPATWLAVVRMLFGLAMTISAIRFIWLGWIYDQYVAPTWHFPYVYFEWVVVPPEPWIYVLFGVLLAGSVAVMIGAWYRLSIILFFLSFTYIELMDKTYYLNHYYFVSLVAFLLCMVPAASAWSVDAWRRPSQQRARLPQWTLDIFKLQLGIVYVHAGLAKITSSWLIDAMPLRIWLPAHADMPILGPLFGLSWVPWAFSWAGMLYDVSIPFLLLYRPTRIYAYLAVIFFHVVTGLLFQIGVFPLVMIMMTTVFFLDRERGTGNGEQHTVTRSLFPVSRSQFPVPRSLYIFFLLQLLIPWRFVLYPGELFWTEEGYRFSWRVMLMEKAGTATFTVTDSQTGRSGVVDNREFLNAHQEKQMAMQPDMIAQYAHMLRDHYAARGVHDPKVTAEVWVTLNGAPSQLLVDPTVDLGKVTLGLHRNAWVTERD